MKNLILNVVRSFKRNKISIIGLIFLLFFGLGVFCTMSNTTANITNEYTSLANKGKLHDFTASELYEIGSASFVPYTKGVSYTCEVNQEQQRTYGNWSNFNFQDSTVTSGVTIDQLFSAQGLAQPQEPGSYTYYLTIPEQTITPHDADYLIDRDYHIVLDPTMSTGLYQTFAQQNPDNPLINFHYRSVKIVSAASQEYSDASDFQALLDIWNAGTTLTAEQIQSLVALNIFSYDYENFNTFIADQSQNIFTVMTTTNTPLANYLRDKYAKELDYRFFKSINVTATEDNIFYKIIDSNPSDTIDTMVLFEDPNDRYGNYLFPTDAWAPYGSEIAFYDSNGKLLEPGSPIDATQTLQFTVPKDFNEIAGIPLYPHSTIASWYDEAKYFYSQVLQIRFKRMLSADRSTVDLDTLLKVLAGLDLDRDEYYNDIILQSSPASRIYQDYDYYLSNWYTGAAESVTISANGNVVFSWVEAVGTPQTCTISNWTSRFSIVNPQHLEKTNRRVIDPALINNFEPYRQWHNAIYHSFPYGEINVKHAQEWFNSLNQNQFGFWIDPSTKQAWTQMGYDIPGQEEQLIVKRGQGNNQWNGIDDQYLAACGGYNQIIWGCGLTPDFMYPVVDISRPTPNTATECLVYCNESGYQSIRLAFINSTVEDYLLARFKPNVNTNRRQVIVDDVNRWARDYMIFPDNVKSAYFADDMNNLLNCAGFRVAYIPNLVNVVHIVSTILCSFIGILCLIICFVIIKRYVENNRVNIGIMRANGIKKWKIGVSLLPFALFPAIIGGIAAYVTGLFLQAPALLLFSNYWMLPTPLIQFDWISFLSCIFLPFLIFALICFITTLIVLRVNAVELMKPGSEFKTNSFSRIAKKPFKHFGVMTRFRVALAFNSIYRLLMLAAMSCLTMSSLVFAMTTFDKLNSSRVTNSTQFDYNFNVQLTTPTTSGSNYITYDYSELSVPDDYSTVKGFGYTDPSQYYFNTSWNTTLGTAEDEWRTQDDVNCYAELTKWYSHNGLIVPLIEDGYRDVVGKNGNLMLPTMSDAEGKDIDLMYLQNKASGRLTLDYNIGIPGIATSNPWEIALSLMPANSRNIAADAFNKIINKVGILTAQAHQTFVREARARGLTVDEETGIVYSSFLVDDDVRSAAAAAGKWYGLGYYALGGYWYSQFPQFFVEHVDEETGETTYSLDSSIGTVGSLLGASFNNDFIKLIRHIYTDAELVKDEYPISYGIIPLNWDGSAKKDETYTYITANFKKLSNGHDFDATAESTIEGIKQDSEFIKLTDNAGNNLNDWLFDENYLRTMNIDEVTHPIVANAYAAHKYGLRVGDTMTVSVTNTADRYEQKIHSEKYNDESNDAVFKIIGISRGTNGEAFYTTQEIANNVLGLPNGKSWNKTHRYMMWSTQDWGDTATTLPSVVDLATDTDNVTIYNFSDGVSQFTHDAPILTHHAKLTEATVPVGFNGIYTENKTGKPITAGVSLYSYTGMYPGASVYKSQSHNKFTEILATGPNLSIANLMTGVNDPKFYDANANYLEGTMSYSDYTRFIEKEFIPIILSAYGDTTMITAICGAMDVAASDLIYNNLISTFDLAETSVMAIIIPITIIIVAIISNLIINDSKRMAAMLKALGYSDSKNLMSILALFVPTIVIGLMLAVPLSFGLTFAYQSIIFNTANILVDVTQKWWYYIAAMGGIGIILVGTYAIGFVSLKRDRLVDQIK